MPGFSRDDAVAILAERRYQAIADILEAAVTKGEGKWTYTDILDHVFLHRWLGIPIFLALLWAVFTFTFALSEPFMVMIELIFGWLGGLAEDGISNPHLASFVAGGICDGLGSVLVFVPPIFMLFFALSILEDSGYLSRAAFVMDRLMYRLGLHGRSFIPMMMGFGCTIPAIMATRSIDGEKDRMITILVSPLISCGARLPVYVLIAGALFGASYAGTVIFSIYLLGIALAIIMALIFRRTLFKGEPSPFVLELPAYSVPTAKAAIIHMWERGRLFLARAGTIIFGTVLVVWFLSAHPWGATSGGELIESSYIAFLGHLLEPVFRPFGWDWMAAVALLFGLLAKEVVVGTYGILLGVEGGALGDSLVSLGLFTPLTGFAFMAFVLIYVPCVATIGVIARETNSYRWAGFVVAYLVALAFVVSGLIIGIGRMLGFS
jgi:ferrous iron transport protein B